METHNLVLWKTFRILHYNKQLKTTIMAKDPAVLLWTKDFLVGTMTMTMEQKGKYITLLCLQHQNQYLTDGDMKSILTEEDIQVAEKFIKEDGKWYNLKMKEESIRRKSYTENRLKNFSKKKDMKVDMNSHMENHTGTVTGTVTVTDTVELELVTGTKAERQDMLADVITGSLDKEQKEIINKFDNIFGDVK
jgi:uncharacterized protein YdaU (DUF1376 family)